MNKKQMSILYSITKEKGLVVTEIKSETTIKAMPSKPDNDFMLKNYSEYFKEEDKKLIDYSQITKDCSC